LLHRLFLHSGGGLCLLLALLLTGGSLPGAAAAPLVASSFKSTTEADYQKAADQYHRLLRNPAAGGRREDWLKGIQELERIYRQDPQSRTAPACLHLTARMQQTMYQRFHQTADLDQAAALFSNVVSLFPQSSEAAESLFALAQIEQSNGNLRGAAKTYYKLVHGYPASSRRAQAEEQLRQLTVIAESLTARKEGRKPGPILKPAQPKSIVSAPSIPVASLPLPKLEPPKTIAASFKPIVPVQATITPAAREKEPDKPVSPKVITASPQIVAGPPVVEDNKPQKKIILSLPVEPEKPAPPKVIAPAPVAKEEKEDSFLAKIGFPFFGG
jgi:tetratricopeptide (TPR) repeat protein